MTKDNIIEKLIFQENEYLVDFYPIENRKYINLSLENFRKKLELKTLNELKTLMVACVEDEQYYLSF